MMWSMMLRRWGWRLLLPVFGVVGGWLMVASPTQAAGEPATAMSYGNSAQVVADERTAPGGPARPRWCRPEVTRDTFLAQQLGITEAELQQARDAATLAWIDHLVSEGRLAEQRADLWRARVKARPYLEPQVLVAQALGMSTDQVQQACTEGKTLADLLAERQMGRQDFTTALRTATEDALQRAVDDGAITEEQAQALKGMALRAWRHGRGKRH